MADFKKIRFVLWLIMILNLIVAGIKTVAGMIIKSSSLTADGFHSITDASSNIIGLIGISIASKPEDKEHPYGHRKYETLCGLVIAGMLVFLGLKIIFDAAPKFFAPTSPSITTESLIALLFTLVVNIFVSSYELKKGKELKSSILTSDAMHTKSDIFVTIGVLITLVGIRFLHLPPIIDPIASLCVSGFILFAAYEVFTQTSGVLVDKATVDTDKIKEIALSYPSVLGVHKIRSRGSNFDVYVDMHLLTDPKMSVEESHELIHSIEKRMKEELNPEIQIIVHIEPYFDGVSEDE